MLIAAAVCPHPPLLVPEMAGEAAPELDALRAACHAAVRRLTQDRDGRAVDLLVVVGGDATTRAYGADAAGSLRPFGLDLTVGRGEPILPLSLTIGRWLLGRAAHAGRMDRMDRMDRADRADRADRMDRTRVRFQGVAERAAPAECLRLGRELADVAERVAMLVMGDGSACRADKASDGLDARAEPYDAAVARAFGTADAAALAALDPALARELQVAGRAAWQVLAGAAGARELDHGREPRPAHGAHGYDGAAFDGAVLADMAPYGVGYFVASWLRSQRRPGYPESP